MRSLSFLFQPAFARFRPPIVAQLREVYAARSSFDGNWAVSVSPTESYGCKRFGSKREILASQVVNPLSTG